jgi:hypothetical protein
MIEVEYDIPIEVTEKQYRRIIPRFRMIVAHRRDAEGRYWIKLWVMGYRDRLLKELAI